MFKQNLAKLLETEMDRKDFLKTLAVAAVALTGVTALIKTLNGSDRKSLIILYSYLSLPYSLDFMASRSRCISS